MQASSSEVVEREARHRLPRLLEALLEEDVTLHIPAEDSPIDLIVTDDHGRRYLIEVKSSSRPGQVARAADQLRGYSGRDIIPILVVPFMSRAGADTADSMRLNWLDLSGNAHIRAENLHLWVQGRPDQLRARGRPSSPFAPKSSRVTRVLLLDPKRWWRQKDLVDATGLDDGNVSRIVRRLYDELLIERDGQLLRPSDPNLLLDAWAQDYRFDAHDILACHLSGSGIELAFDLARRLKELNIRHAFTGLSAAWALDNFARFRLTTVYIDGDPRDAAERLDVRIGERGANVQLVGPNDQGVFTAEKDYDGLRCVAPVQVYIDLINLPERARDAAQYLRDQHLRWRNGSATS